MLERTYKKKVESSRGNMTDTQIREAKNQRSSERRRQRKEQRKNIAEQRNNYWQKLTPQQQIESLDQRLGKGRGAKRQRIKISG